MSRMFLDADKNDEFSNFRGIDLQDLLVDTENYFLEYREKLNLPSFVTFGVELEYEGLRKSVTDKYIKRNLHYWHSKSDSSLKTGGEINSPIMSDKIQYWKELKLICNYLTKRKVDTMHNAGGHIHIGASVLGKDLAAWRNFLKLYIAYESVLFRFIYGDKINERRNLLKYAPPIADILYEKLSDINEARYVSTIWNNLPTFRKYAALNFKNVDFCSIDSRLDKNTLEFRSPNASTSAVIWQNNINAFTKMLVSSREKVMDEEFLDYKLKHEYLPYLGNEYLYNEVNLKNVLEFVDLVFDNNLDKIYFLRQYLKNFEDNYGMKTTIKAKKFVK